LDIEIPFPTELKPHEMTPRLDGLYDVIVELEEKFDDVKLRRKAVEQDAITLENL
jgi:site-specific DNA recombinase